MRILFTLFLWLTALSMSLAQNSIYSQPISSSSDRTVYNTILQKVGNSYDNTWNVGSARKLEGRIYLLEVWLTQPGTSWNYSDVSEVQRKINSAVDFLKSSARSYGKSLEFELGSYGGDNYKGIPMSGLPRSYEDACNSGDLLVRALRQIGYSSMLQCYNQLHDDMNCDNVVVLVIINNDGWSCANNFSTAHAQYGYESYFLENAFIFRTNNGNPILAESIAHEMLHLFGAWDMYQPQCTPQADQWCRQNYPNEIMMTVSKPLSELRISPLTAWLTGLSSNYNDWYMYFKRVSN